MVIQQSVSTPAIVSKPTYLKLVAPATDLVKVEQNVCTDVATKLADTTADTVTVDCSAPTEAALRANDQHILNESE